MQDFFLEGVSVGTHTIEIDLRELRHAITPISTAIVAR